MVKKLYNITKNWTPEMIDDYIATDFRFLAPEEQRQMKHFMHYKLRVEEIRNRRYNTEET
jgi:hypothetical protein